MDTPFEQTHERFLASVSAARKHYVAVDFANKERASIFLWDICRIIKPVPPSLAIEWLKGEMRSLYDPIVAADWEFALDLLEYCFRSLRWEEGRDMLVELFNELKDPSYRLRLEVMIKRYYDPHWEGGDCEFTDLGPSIWDLLEEKK